MLSRPYRTQFFRLEIRKKSGTFKVKRGMELKKREFMPESGNIDTHGVALERLSLLPSIMLTII